MSRVVWLGDAVKRRFENAVRKGLAQTGRDCVATAKDLVHKDTTTLQGSIQVRGPYKIPSGYVLLWGSFDVNYAKYQEMLPPARGGKAYLRPAADKHYPELTDNIKRFHDHG